MMSQSELAHRIWEGGLPRYLLTLPTKFLRNKKKTNQGELGRKLGGIEMRRILKMIEKKEVSA